MTKLDLQAAKIELAQIILNTNSAEILAKVKALLEGGGDFYNSLTSEQKREIEIARKQIENGETISWKELKQTL